jgi:hypothetical protein
MKGIYGTREVYVGRLIGLLALVILSFSAFLLVTNESFASNHCSAGQSVNPETGQCYTPVGGGGGQNTGNQGQNTGGQGQNSGGSLINPLQSTTVAGFLMNIIDILLIFATPVIIFFIIYAGYLFVTARGESGQIQTARTALTWAIVGGVVIVGARLIISVIQNTVSAL